MKGFVKGSEALRHGHGKDKVTISIKLLDNGHYPVYDKSYLVSIECLPSSHTNNRSVRTNSPNRARQNRLEKINSGSKGKNVISETVVRAGTRSGH